MSVHTNLFHLTRVIVEEPLQSVDNNCITVDTEAAATLLLEALLLLETAVDPVVVAVLSVDAAPAASVDGDSSVDRDLESDEIKIEIVG